MLTWSIVRKLDLPFYGLTIEIVAMVISLILALMVDRVINQVLEKLREKEPQDATRDT
jgi:hypothetical protein